jgi:hypothetical protein
MARDEAYREAEVRIEWARRAEATELDLSYLKLTELPESLGNLVQLRSLDLTFNRLTALSESLGNLVQLRSLDLSFNRLTALPESLGNLAQLQSLNLCNNQLIALPESLGNLVQLQLLDLSTNQLTTTPEYISRLKQLQVLLLTKNQFKDLPAPLAQLVLSGNFLIEYDKFHARDNYRMSFEPPEEEDEEDDDDEDEEYAPIDIRSFKNSHSIPIGQLRLWGTLSINDNPLNPELAEADKQGLDAVKAYLRAKAAAQITLNEAKLILVGEGEVGKTCLMDALLGNPWKEHDTTHGIEIKPIKVIDPDSSKEITLNGWDFGGQRIYRPTHQLFFSAPAVYLVVWKPREGPQQGFVKEWIKLIKHREPEARILVVATHGGPQQRQPDIDRQELWDIFGNDTVIDFFFVESKPDEDGKRRGIEKLKQAIARVASTLPEMGRSVPRRWQETRDALEKTDAAYLPLERVLELCRAHQMDDEEARLFVTIEHRLGHLIHYEHDPALRDIVVLKPDWLATAISFVLDDEETRKMYGLVRFSRLSQLWDNPTRPSESRYPTKLHFIFLRLMERFDLSYRVAGLSPKGDSDPVSLIAQLVPDNRPNPILGWVDYPLDGNAEQMQICRIVDDKGQSSPAEGLFYQLIVRLHKYSLGRVHYNDSVHWQRGLVLDDDYNGRALLEYIGNDVRITVRAPYPERFLAMLTEEVKYLVESFWEGLHCDVMVPCVKPCGRSAPGTGLFDVQKLIESKRKKRPEYPCIVCNEWQNIDSLLRNAPAARPVAAESIFAEFAQVKHTLAVIYQKMRQDQAETQGLLNRLDSNDQKLLSRVDDAFAGFMRALTDEAKEGPRLFSLLPVDRRNFNPREWTRAKFRLTLWCEHSRLPLPVLPPINPKNEKNGVYEFELTREWFKKAAPFLKVMTGTLSIVLPVASSTVKLALDDTAYKAIEEQLDFGKSIIDASIGEGVKVGEWMGAPDATSLESGEAREVQGAALREFHALLKSLDSASKFGGLVRVTNKQQKFLWVHPMYEKEY